MYNVYYTSLFLLKHFLQKQLRTKQICCVYCVLFFISPLNDAIYVAICPLFSSLALLPLCWQYIRRRH